MATRSGKFCPECGGDKFAKERVNGVDTGDTICINCKAVHAPGDLLDDKSPRSCKAPKCGQFIPKKRAHLMTLKKDYVANLRKGLMACPFCGALHHAENVVISERGPGTGIYSGTMGELVKK